MCRTSLRSWSWVLLLPALAHAHSVGDELSVNSSQTTAASPRTGGISDRLSGTAEFSDQWALEGDMTLTHENAVPNTASTSSRPLLNANGSSGTNIFAFTIGPDWTPNDHWDVGVSLTVSPSSTEATNAPFSTTAKNGGTVDYNSQVRVVNSSRGVQLSGSYGTAGESNHETLFDASLSGSTNSTDQRVLAVESPTGALTGAQLLALCRAGKVRCSAQERNVLRGATTDLQELVLGAGVIETLFSRTDLGLSGTYYLYSQDPTTVGFYSLSVVGRARGGSGGTLGAGIPVAPLQWTLRPSVEHRFGAFSAEVYYEFGEFVSSAQGSSHTLGGNLQYKFSRSFRMYVTFNGSTSVTTTPADPSVAGSAAVDTTTNSGGVAVGAKYTF